MFHVTFSLVSFSALFFCAKGNLIHHLTGKQAYTVYNRKTRESIRIELKARPEGLSREDSFAYYQSKEPCEMFDVTPETIRADLALLEQKGVLHRTHGGAVIRMYNNETPMENPVTPLMFSSSRSSWK